MRAILLNTITWLLVASGAFLFVRGGLDYWESRNAQQQIASEWITQQTSQPSAPVSNRIETPGSVSQGASPGSFRAESPEPAQPHYSFPRQGAAVARLVIPRLKATLYVVEGDDDRDLKRGPGHLIDTAMPGQYGNCVIAGHRDTHFRILKDIRKGDEILLTRNGDTYRYRVDEMSIVSPDNVSPLRPTREPVLNLVTCYPFYYVGSAPRRFIVHARLENEPLRAAR